MADQAEVSQLYTQTEYEPSTRVEVSELFLQVESSPGQVEIGRMFIQVEYSLVQLNVVVGTIESGNAGSVWKDDADVLVVKEVNATPGLNIGFTFSGVQAEKPKVISFKAWYEGDESHNIKLQIKKNDQTWADVVNALFPTAVSEQSYSWDLPVPISDYVYDSLLQLRTYQSSNGSDSRKLHVNFISLNDKSSGGGIKLVRSLSL